MSEEGVVSGFGISIHPITHIGLEPITDESIELIKQLRELILENEGTPEGRCIISQKHSSRGQGADDIVQQPSF